jgi:Ciliary basal body-associated, B9 protein
VPLPPNGVLQVAGCTHVSAGRWRGSGFTERSAGAFVCHFAHPLEYELELRSGAHAALHDVPPQAFPTLFVEVRASGRNRHDSRATQDHLYAEVCRVRWHVEDVVAIVMTWLQVHSLDRQFRNAPQGYGHLCFAQHSAGCASHTISTWRPMPSLKQKVASWYVGGGPALKHVDFVMYPGAQWGQQFLDKAMNKMCTASEPGGSVRVRTTIAVQYPDACAPPTILCAEAL